MNKISSHDAAELTWLFSGGGSGSSGSNVGPLLERLRLFAVRSRECRACGGLGILGGVRMKAARKRRANARLPELPARISSGTVDVLRALELDHLIRESNADAANGGACPKCNGSGGRTTDGGNPRNHAAAGPLLGGSTVCRACRGVTSAACCAKAPEPSCGGRGYLWLDLIGSSPKAQQGGAGAGPGDETAAHRAGEIERRLRRACLLYRDARRILGAYYGDDGATAGDPIIALYPLTEAGKKLLTGENPNELCAIQRLAADVSAERASSVPRRTTLLTYADSAARAIYALAADAWNRGA